MKLAPWKRGQTERSLAQGGAMGTLTHLRDEFDQFFNRMMGNFWSETADAMPARRDWAPLIDFEENDKEFTLRADIPGVDPKDVQVAVSGRLLTIAGEKSRAQERSDKDVVFSERSYGRFQRTLELPETAELEQVSAEHANGVVTVRIPKKAGSTARRIPVRAASQS